MMYILLKNLIIFYLDDVHPLRNLIIFYLDNVHPFKESYRLFIWTMYILLRNLIVFYLDDVHPFKESYRLNLVRVFASRWQF